MTHYESSQQSPRLPQYINGESPTASSPPNQWWPRSASAPCSHNCPWNGHHTAPLVQQSMSPYNQVSQDLLPTYSMDGQVGSSLSRYDPSFTGNPYARSSTPVTTMPQPHALTHLSWAEHTPPSTYRPSPATSSQVFGSQSSSYSPALTLPIQSPYMGTGSFHSPFIKMEEPAWMAIDTFTPKALPGFVNPEQLMASPEIHSLRIAIHGEEETKPLLDLKQSQDASSIVPVHEESEARPSPPRRRRSVTTKETAVCECSVCGQLFRRKNNLRIHSIKHDPNHQNQYGCGNCDMAFRRENDLQRHVKSVSSKDHSSKD